MTQLYIQETILFADSLNCHYFIGKNQLGSICEQYMEHWLSVYLQLRLVQFSIFLLNFLKEVYSSSFCRFSSWLFYHELLIHMKMNASVWCIFLVSLYFPVIFFFFKCLYYFFGVPIILRQNLYFQFIIYISDLKLL